MEKLKKNWMGKLWYEKVIFIIGMLTSVTVVVLAVLQLCNVWEDAAYLYMPMLAVLMLVQAFENRKRSRGIAIFSLGVAVFISLVWVLLLFGL